MDTYSEEWRHICECKYYAKLKFFEHQKARSFIDLVAKRRSQEAAGKLEADSVVWFQQLKEWKRRKTA